MNSLSESLLKSMEQMVEKKSDKGASVIECEIYSVIDAEKRVYYAKYCGVTYLTVYATNTTINYVPGDRVYVIVPQGDLSEKKLILGAVAGEYSGEAQNFIIEINESEEALVIK